MDEYEIMNWYTSQSLLKLAGRMTLYHGTTAGPNMERLHSFRQQGANPMLSDGNGQGQGFYTFTDPKAAQEQATYDQVGVPMVVVIDADVNPREFRLDNEIHNRETSQFMKQLFPYIRMLGRIELPVRAGWEYYAECKNAYVDGKGVFIPVVKTHPESGNTARGNVEFNPANETTGVSQALVSGTIMNRLRAKHPQEVYRLERGVLGKGSKENNKAIVYYGQKPLPVSRIFVQQEDGKWFNATTNDPPPEVRLMVA